MTISDWAIVLATFLGPCLAIVVQNLIDRFRTKRAAKKQVFSQLMATRAVRLSAEHVQALNMIDVAFHDTKSVREAWRALFDNFNRKGQDETEWGIINAERDRL